MTRQSALTALLASIAISLLLYLLPLWLPSARVLAWPLMLLSTLFHELGHAGAALVSGGSFESLRVYADGSGVAATASNGSRWMRAGIAAGGPLGPPLTALLLFLAARNARHASFALALLAGLLLALLLFRVRNVFGICFVGALAVGLALVAWRGSMQTAQIATCFMAIQLSLAAFSRADYLFTAEAHTGAGILPSDTAQIAQALLLPYWFWGGLIGILSVVVLAGGIVLFSRALR